MNTVKCPTCEKIVTWDSGNPWRPFCSQRCKLIDLGEWAGETHRIAGDPADEFIAPSQGSDKDNY